MQGALRGISSDKFWSAVDELVATSEVVVDRPRGSRHPRIPEAIYPVDYGYLAGTTGGDGDGIDVWVGSIRPAVVTGVVCTVDSRKRDAEVKILLGCTHEEEVEILAFLNKGLMAAVLVSAPAPSATS
jgi:inorganic pyrophosphatase